MRGLAAHVQRLGDARPGVAGGPCGDDGSVNEPPRRFDLVDVLGDRPELCRVADLDGAWVEVIEGALERLGACVGSFCARLASPSGSSRQNFGLRSMQWTVYGSSLYGSASPISSRVPLLV